jgi:hypothetical protein
VSTRFRYLTHSEVALWNDCVKYADSIARKLFSDNYTVREVQQIASTLYIQAIRSGHLQTPVLELAKTYFECCKLAQLSLPDTMPSTLLRTAATLFISHLGLSGENNTFEVVEEQGIRNNT